MPALYRQDAAADELLGRDPLALLATLLDRHMRQRSSEVRRRSVVTRPGR